MQQCVHVRAIMKCDEFEDFMIFNLLASQLQSDISSLMQLKHESISAIIYSTDYQQHALRRTSWHMASACAISHWRFLTFVCLHCSQSGPCNTRAVSK